MTGGRIYAALLALSLSLTAPAQAFDWLPAGLTAIKHGNGWSFADSRGMTVYTYDKDEETPGGSNCKNDCAKTWPPVLAAANAQAHGPWTIVTRIDGAKQWAFKGKPLYTYAMDAFPGATFGDGVGTIWWIALQPIPTPAEVTIGPTTLGQVLRDARGLTLYTFDSDTKPGKSACTKACAKTWRPIVAPYLANADEDWTIVTREDGTKQWAFKGKPLYRFANDINPGEISGEKVGKGWHAAVLEPPPPKPPFVTVQASDAGELLANDKGITIYAHGASPRNRIFLNPDCKGKPCDGIDPEWVPLLAAADAKPVGSWSLIDLPDSTKQWAYKGQKLYTNVNDTKPGDFKGIRFGGDHSWNALMRNGQPMQGVTVGG